MSATQLNSPSGVETSKRFEPMVVIVSGPSGSGKSTLVEKILELPRTMLSVSCTTRPPRKTESTAKWYNFISEPEFESMVQRGDFLEYAQVFGKHWYGSPRRWLDEAKEKQFDLVLEIDVQGAAQVKRLLPSAISILILPPSREELEKRIRARGQDSVEAIARRLDRARQELERYGDYEYLVINDDQARAGREIQAIVIGERCRLGRQQGNAQEILKSFGG
jgi:guanylate kinase